MGLVIKEGSNYVPNPDAYVAKEVRDYLVSQHEYGNREACFGKALEACLRGRPMDGNEMLRLVLAVLFRAGVIEFPSVVRSSILTVTRGVGNPSSTT